MDNPYAAPEGGGRPREPRGPGESREPGPPGESREPGPPAEPREPGPPTEPREPGGRRLGRRRPSGPPPTIDPADLRLVNARIVTFVLLVLAALLTSTFPLPWQLGGLAFAVAAIGVGIAALVAARKPGLRQQVAPLIVVGLVFTTLMTLSMATTLLLWSAQLERQTCLDTALTIEAREACESTYEDAVERRLEELSGRAP